RAGQPARASPGAASEGRDLLGTPAGNGDAVGILRRRGQLVSAGASSHGTGRRPVGDRHAPAGDRAPAMDSPGGPDEARCPRRAYAGTDLSDLSQEPETAADLA